MRVCFRLAPCPEAGREGLQTSCRVQVSLLAVDHGCLCELLPTHPSGLSCQECIPRSCCCHHPSSAAMPPLPLLFLPFFFFPFGQLLKAHASALRNGFLVSRSTSKEPPQIVVKSKASGIKGMGRTWTLKIEKRVQWFSLDEGPLLGTDLCHRGGPLHYIFHSEAGYLSGH